jgi:hypothetical protein
MNEFFTMMPTPALAAVPEDHQETVPGRSLKAREPPAVAWASVIMRKSRFARSRETSSRLAACPCDLAMKKPCAFQVAPL